MRNSKLIKRAFRKNLATSVISIAVTGINSILDGLLMGNLIGPKALSAINLAMPVNYVLLTVESIFAAGASILASKALGEREDEDANTYFSLSVISVVAAGIIIALLSSPFAGTVTDAICHNADLIEGVRKYCGVLLIVSPVIMLQVTLSRFVQQSGFPTDALKANIVSMAGNMIMDVVYIKVLGMDLKGAALATGTGALVACGVMIFSLKKHKLLRLCMPSRKSCSKMIAMLGAGTAGAIQTLSMGILTFVLNYFIQRNLGADGLFVLSVGINFMMFSMFFAIGVQGIFVSMGSMMQGQKDDTGLLMLYRRCMMTGIPFTVILSLIQILFPKTIGRIYGADTPELLSATSNGLRLIALYSPPLAILMISIAVWQVCGFFRTATLVSGSMLMTVPLCLLLMSVSAPPFMIWWALPLSAVLTLFIAAAASSVCRKGKTHKLRFFTLLPKNNADKFVFEGSAEVNPKNKAELNALISQTVEYYDSLNIDKNTVSKICLCTEEMMIFLAEHSVRGKSFMDLRIVADSETVSVLLLDNCPPYDPLNGSDSVFSREILKAFCPDLDHRYSFGQNMTFMEWKINT